MKWIFKSATEAVQRIEKKPVISIHAERHKSPCRTVYLTCTMWEFERLHGIVITSPENEK